MTSFNNEMPYRSLTRGSYLETIRAALSLDLLSFAREAVLHWLVNYSGDLKAGFLYAKVLLKENKDQQALKVLHGLCSSDPEYVEAVHLLARIETNEELEISGKKKLPSTEGQVYSYLKTPSDYIGAILYHTLGGHTDRRIDIPIWGKKLREARRILYRGDLTLAEEKIREVLRINPDSLIASVTHLDYLLRNEKISNSNKCRISKQYYEKWPDSLKIQLLLGHWLVMGGEPDEGVALLHEAASRDIIGQVARRIWGKPNPYQKLWPEQLDLQLKVQIPYEVISYLGWNQLPKGDHTRQASIFGKVFGIEKLFASKEIVETGISIAAGKTVASVALERDHSRKNTQSIMDKRIEADISDSIREELDRMAAKRKIPGITRFDGRYPVYVVFSSRKKLEELYGLESTDKIEMEMRKVVSAVQKLPHWNARLFLPEDPKYTQSLDIEPLQRFDPWQLKLSLTDLDASLSKRGEMIGAVLIVGGPEVIPFHRLPNPVDDPDIDVLSDSPYATRDENYFLPEWSVGRIPGGAEGSPTLLLDTLSDIAKQHNKSKRRRTWINSLAGRFFSFLRTGILSDRKSFGYSAAIWQKASLAVFRPIGKEKRLIVSPPSGIDEKLITPSNNGRKRSSKKFHQMKLPIGHLSYFNLHGLEDASEWYGQSDPTLSSNGHEYPVALRPLDIGKNGRRKGNRIPQIVFSEACYGLNIIRKTVDAAMSLKFLQSGTKAIVGSTCMSYGSIKPPLIAADLLAYGFWKFVQDGYAIGEALKRAKIHLTRVMNERQGYLDGEDQKTLISFVLFGDPLVKMAGGKEVRPKGVMRVRYPNKVKTVCDRSNELEDLGEMPQEVIEGVREVVAHYLPGMSDSRWTLSKERNHCNGIDHVCPTSQLKGASKELKNSSRRLLTLRKSVQGREGNHDHYARVTLNGNGKIVKIAVSR